jgi:hypothetical protein
MMHPILRNKTLKTHMPINTITVEKYHIYHPDHHRYEDDATWKQIIKLNQVSFVSLHSSAKYLYLIIYRIYRNSSFPQLNLFARKPRPDLRGWTQSWRHLQLA